VLSFFSSRPNWDSPTPSPAGERAPPPFGSGGAGYALACGGGGGAVPFPRIYVLVAQIFNLLHANAA